MKWFWMVGAFMSTSVSFGQEWTSDLAEAFKRAEAENKKVLLFFTVPDACAPCTELEETIWKSPEFSSFANDRYVLARADFDYNGTSTISESQKAENLLIVEKYNKDGFFPLVVIIDKNARIVGSKGTYNGETPSVYLTALDSITSQ